MDVHSCSRRALVAGSLAMLGSLAACTTVASPSTSPSAVLTEPAKQAGPVSIALRVLVLDDSTPLIAALADRLQREGIPFDSVQLAAGRTPFTDAFLGSQDGDRLEANYSGVIAPALTHPALTASEKALLIAFQQTFGVRLIETDASSRLPAVGATARYEGPINGLTATVTDAARTSGFGYLRGPVTFAQAGDNLLVRAVPSLARAKETFTPLLTLPIADSSEVGAVLGVASDAGCETLVASFAGTVENAATQILAHGMIAWLTRGLSTSFNRNYFSVHADDVLLGNAQWSVEGNCEVGRNCPTTVPQLAPVRMVAADVDHLVDWQRSSGVKVDLVMNGAGAGLYAAAHGGRDPLMEAIAAHKADLRLISHTWSHAFLGCEQVLTPNDWSCKTDADGRPLYRSVEFVRDEIVMNQAFFKKNNLVNYAPCELVTGEHSGLAKPPEMKADNPNLAAALTAAGITWVAADASTEDVPRTIGSATTVPRYPIDLDYNVSTARQAASQYNWLHTATADKGSGECELDPNSPCAAPVKLDTGFADVIVPMEASAAFVHAVTNDARPHFVHQVNLASERLLYPILDGVVSRYRDTFADNAPLINPSMSDAGGALRAQQRWESGEKQVVARLAGPVVQVANHATEAMEVPLTLPQGTRVIVGDKVGADFGQAYGGSASGWVTIPAGTTMSFQLPAASGFADAASWPKNGG